MEQSRHIDRRLAAILSADVHGYSRMMGADDSGTVHAVKICRGIIGTKVTGYRGRIVDAPGDNVLAEFPSAADAVQCAVEIQHELADRNQTLEPTRRMEFRIGVHLGDVINDDDTIYGDAVNIAARLEAIADPGGIALSEDAWRQAHTKIGVEFADLGYRELKNIRLPVRVYAASPSDLRAPTSTGGLRMQYPPLPDKPSIAVLPLLNLGENQEQDYFADAIAEDIVTALSRWRWFFVIARNSSFAYKGRAVDVKQIGKELGVRYLLEGSIRRSGSRVRMTAQLIDATTSAHIWAENFDRELADIFALEDEITECVVSAIEPAMLRSEENRIARQAPRNLSAFDCFLRGMWHFNKMSQSGYHEALGLFRECIARDPNLSLGHIGLARTLYGGVIDGYCDDPAKDLFEAEAQGEIAVQLDARDAHAHFALSGALLYLGRHAEALDRAQKAIALNPNFAFGHFRLGQVLTYSGRPAEAVVSIERSIRHSPHDPQLGSMITLLALAHYHARSYEEALRHAKAAVHLHEARAGAVLAATLACLGRDDEARSTLSEFLPSLAQPSSRRGVSLSPYADSADRDHLLQGLRAAGLRQG